MISDSAWRAGRGAGAGGSLRVRGGGRARPHGVAHGAPRTTPHAHSRLSIASRSGSVLEKRYSDTSSCLDEVPGALGVAGVLKLYWEDQPFDQIFNNGNTRFNDVSSLDNGKYNGEAIGLGSSVHLLQIEWQCLRVTQRPEAVVNVGNRSLAAAERSHSVDPTKTMMFQKPPMPLIQEHPIDKLNVENNNERDTSVNNNDVPAEPHSNYVNVTPVTIDAKAEIDYGNYANVDLTATLEKFESSLQILRSAGFSQEELDALEDIPEHEDDISTATTNTVHPSTECCNDHINYMHMEPLEISSSSSNKNCSDNIRRISHVSDPTQHSDTISTVSTRRSSSADFTKKT
ncbi:hypothetical protein ACJJTC_002392 [Scirpophaga incertulas]